MKYITPIIRVFKPILPLLVIIGILKLTGQLGNTVTLIQSTVLKTGALNASVVVDSKESFDYRFFAKTIDGKILSPDSLKGKVIFLNLWATWCGPCRAEMPTIQGLYDSIDKKDLAFVMLSIDRVDPFQKVKRYIDKEGYTFPVYILSSQPTEQLKVPTIPTTYVISKTGEILLKEVGMRNYDTNKFRKFLNAEASK